MRSLWAPRCSMDRLRRTSVRCARSSRQSSMPAADPIASLLAGTFPDPETGELLRADSRSVVIEDSLEGAENELVAGLGLDRHVAVISDANTHAVLGARVERALAGRFTVQ